MCQSKSQGGRRCAAHNNAREFNRAKRELKAAVNHRDSLIAAYESGNERVSEEDIAAAEHTVLVRADLAMLMDPKLTDEQLEQMWDSASPEVQAAARPVAQSIIEHGRSAAKLSGEASTARMFDRTEEAEQFEEEADAERGKADRLVDALRAALTDTKTHLSEGVHDAAVGDDSTVTGGVFGVLRDFASETGQTLRDGVGETAAAIGEGLDETVEALAAGVGIGVPVETGHDEHGDGDGGDSESSDDESTAAEGVDDDSGDDAQDSTAAADESDDDDAADDDQSEPRTGDGPRQAHAQSPARDNADSPTAESIGGDSAGAGPGHPQVKGRTDSESPSAGKRQDKSRVRTPSTSAGGTPSPAPGIGHGHGVTPKPQPVRQVRAEPSAGVMGTPQKSAEQTFDVTRLSDSELLSFIARLYQRLRG